MIYLLCAASWLGNEHRWETTFTPLPTSKRFGTRSSSCLQTVISLCKRPIMEKLKAQRQVRVTPARFYQYGWFYHFKHAIARHVRRRDELLITAASVKTKKAQGVFTNAVNDVVQQHIDRSQWRTSFCPCACDPCLQIADYCTWAIRRKWELTDARSYNLIRDRITYEYDLWDHGTCHFY